MTPESTPENMRTPTVRQVPETELHQVVHGEHGDPHDVLGPHPHDGGVTVRVLKPLASRVVVRWDGAGSPGETELTHEHATSDLTEQMALSREVSLDLVGVLASS